MNGTAGIQPSACLREFDSDAAGGSVHCVLSESLAALVDNVVVPGPIGLGDAAASIINAVILLLVSGLKTVEGHLVAGITGRQLHRPQASVIESTWPRYEASKALNTFKTTKGLLGNKGYGLRVEQAQRPCLCGQLYRRADALVADAALSIQGLSDVLNILGFDVRNRPRPALFRAARALMANMRRGSVKTGVLPA